VTFWISVLVGALPTLAWCALARHRRKRHLRAFQADVPLGLLIPAKDLGRLFGAGWRTKDLAVLADRIDLATRGACRSRDMTVTLLRAAAAYRMPAGGAADHLAWIAFLLDQDACDRDGLLRDPRGASGAGRCTLDVALASAQRWTSRAGAVAPWAAAAGLTLTETVHAQAAGTLPAPSVLAGMASLRGIRMPAMAKAPTRQRRARMWLRVSRYRPAALSETVEPGLALGLWAAAQ
jgi:hypothetical protein